MGGDAATLAAKAVAPSCCSTFYEQDWVRELAGDSFHPGGEALSRRTVEAMALPAGASLADLGCGTGTTALLLAGSYGLQVTGLDLSEANLERARTRAAEAGVAVSFQWSDACTLPFENDSLDGLLAECVFSLLPDKPAALAEFRRVLGPKGKLAVTDMCLGGELPDDIARMLAPWTCLTDALSRDGYLDLFRNAGFVLEEESEENEGLYTLIGKLKRKMLLLGTGAALSGRLPPDIDLAEIRHWLDRFSDEVRQKRISYHRFNLSAT
jgi:ubiquinone/menaquinone biosynthesis C-methylase UbiE